MNNTIELRNVSKTFYCGAETIKAVDRLSIHVATGEMLAVVGPSGSGKTTLLNLMGCLDQPTSGQVLIEGRDTSRMPDKMLSAIRQEKIGFVFQKFFLLPTLTALENVLMPCVFHRGVGHAEKERAKNLLSIVGMDRRMNHMPSALSGGEMQRTAVARSLILSPEILIADEPTGNLDSANTRQIVDLLLKLNQSGLTIIHVTHNRSIGELSDRVLFMKDGRITNVSEPSPGENKVRAV